MSCVAATMWFAEPKSMPEFTDVWLGIGMSEDAEDDCDAVYTARQFMCCILLRC